MLYIAFYRNHVSTGEPLKDDLFCWTFNIRNVYDSELARLRDMDHIAIVGYGSTIEKD